MAVVKESITNGIPEGLSPETMSEAGFTSRMADEGGAADVTTGIIPT